MEKVLTRDKLIARFARRRNFDPNSSPDLGEALRDHLMAELTWFVSEARREQKAERVRAAFDRKVGKALE